MKHADRVSPTEVRHSSEILLVCAYEDEGKFEENHLEGAVSLDTFRERLPEIPKSARIAFY